MSTKIYKINSVHNSIFLRKPEEAEAMWFNFDKDIKVIKPDSFIVASNMDIIKYIVSFPDKFMSIPRGEKTNCHFVLEDNGSKQAFKDDMGLWDPIFSYNTRSYDVSSGRRVSRCSKDLKYTVGLGLPDQRNIWDYKYTFFRHHQSKDYLKKCFVVNNYVLYIYTGMIDLNESSCCLKKVTKSVFDISFQKKNLSLKSENFSNKSDSKFLNISDIIVKILTCYKSNNFQNIGNSLKKNSYAIYKSEKHIEFFPKCCWVQSEIKEVACVLDKDNNLLFCNDGLSNTFHGKIHSSEIKKAVIRLYFCFCSSSIKKMVIHFMNMTFLSYEGAKSPEECSCDALLEKSKNILMKNIDVLPSHLLSKFPNNFLSIDHINQMKTSLKKLIS